MCNEPVVIRELHGVKVKFGGEEHSGWLLRGAARPMPTPVESAMVDFEILDLRDGGSIFEFSSRNTSHHGDTWHETVEDALEQATHSFGIEREEWRTVERPAG